MLERPPRRDVNVSSDHRAPAGKAQTSAQQRRNEVVGRGYGPINVDRSCGLVVECPPCTRETGVQFPVESNQRLLKVVPDATLLGTQHEGLDWGKFPCDVQASCPGGV